VLHRRGGEGGLTLIEVLVVVLIAGILMAITVPRLFAARRRVTEANLRRELYTLRAAIERFQGDTGLYPQALEDLLLATPPPYVQRDSWSGPYLQTLPQDPITHRRDWNYDPSTGTVRSQAVGVTMEGIPYSQL